MMMKEIEHKVEIQQIRVLTALKSERKALRKQAQLNNHLASRDKQIGDCRNWWDS